MKKLVIVGKSCSGKTELTMRLKRKGLRIAVMHTSRPIRQNETDGLHYRFVSRDHFEELIHRNQFVEWDEFNNWFYGITKEELEKSDAIISTPRGLKKIIEKYGRDWVTVVFLDIPATRRLYRSTQRGDNIEEVKRRFLTDEEDFREFVKLEDWDLRIDLRIDDNFNLLMKLFS